MGKEGKEKKKKDRQSGASEAAVTPVEQEKPEVDYSTKIKYCAKIAKPLAEEKLCKKVLKLAKKAAKRKLLRRGVKEVVKALRKNTKGICILAGDISPIDVLTHIPIVCEDHGVQYIYVPSKEDLGAAALSKRPTSCMLLLPRPVKGAVDAEEQKEYEEAYTEVEKKIKAAAPVF